MLKHIIPFAIAAVAFAATPSGAYAESGAAEASHARVQAAWDAMDAERETRETIAKSLARPETTITSKITDETAPAASVYQQPPPVVQEQSWPLIGIGML